MPDKKKKKAPSYNKGTRIRLEWRAGMKRRDGEPGAKSEVRLMLARRHGCSAGQINAYLDGQDD